MQWAAMSFNWDYDLPTGTLLKSILFLVIATPPPHPPAQTVPLWTCFAWSKQEAVISASAQLPQDEGGIAG